MPVPLSLSLSLPRKIEIMEKQLTRHTKNKPTQKPNTRDYKFPTLSFTAVCINSL